MSAFLSAAINLWHGFLVHAIESVKFMILKVGVRHLSRVKARHSSKCSVLACTVLRYCKFSTHQAANPLRNYFARISVLRLKRWVHGTQSRAHISYLLLGILALSLFSAVRIHVTVYVCGWSVLSMSSYITKHCKCTAAPRTWILIGMLWVAHTTEPSEMTAKQVISPNTGSAWTSMCLPWRDCPALSWLHCHVSQVETGASTEKEHFGWQSLQQPYYWKALMGDHWPGLCRICHPECCFAILAPASAWLTWQCSQENARQCC